MRESPPLECITIGTTNLFLHCNSILIRSPTIAHYQHWMSGLSTIRNRHNTDILVSDGLNYLNNLLSILKIILLKSCFEHNESLFQSP